MQIRLVGKQPLLLTKLRVLDPHEPGLTIDATRLTFASPLELAGVASMLHHSAHRGQEACLTLPSDQNVSRYLQRMDLINQVRGFGRVLGRVDSDQRTDLSHTLLELTRIQESFEADDVAGKVVPLARRHSSMVVTSAIFIALGEMLDNASSHASSPTGVYVAAQTYTGATSGHRGLELAVADAGIGILNHLRNNPRYARFTSAVTALRYAVQPGVTGTRDRRGYGFTDTLDEVSRAGLGRLIIRSGNAVGRITVRHGHTRQTFVRSPEAIEGTWIWLRVRIP